MLNRSACASFVTVIQERLAKPLLQCRAHLTNRLTRNLSRSERLRRCATSRKTHRNNFELLSNTMHARRSNVREARDVHIMTPDLRRSGESIRSAASARALKCCESLCTNSSESNTDSLDANKGTKLTLCRTLPQSRCICLHW